MAELLWAMMAKNTSMAITVDALFDMANISLAPEITEDKEENIYAACGAIRSLGASLWGNPPQISGNQSLRIYWSSFLDLLAAVSSSVHDRSGCCVSPIISSLSFFPSPYSTIGSNREKDDDCFMTPPKIKDAVFENSISLVLVHEIVVSVRRLVDGDLSSGSDTLSLDEWTAFISLLEMGLLPWLADLNAADFE
jgi:hypothetical protein